MEVTFKFDPEKPEEMAKLEDVLAGFNGLHHDWQAAVEEFLNLRLRPWIKHESHDFPDVQSALEGARRALWEELDERHLGRYLP